MSFKKLYTQNKIQIISIVSLIICSIFSVGFYHPDEHYQIIEFASYKLGHTNASQLPWEFHERIRPTLQPILTLLLIKFCHTIALFSPFIITIIFRLISSLLSFYTLNKLFNFYKKEFESSYISKWFKYFSYFSWFLVFIGVRYSSENWSACIFIIGILNFLSIEKKRSYNFIILGLFFGITFLFRFQSAFFIIGFVLWLIFIYKSNIKHILYLGLSFSLIFSLGIILDSWFYQSITITPYNYFHQNIILNKAANYGIEPWWFYLKSGFEKGIPPISILFIASTFIFFIKNSKNPLTWVSLPFILIHFLIGHKELRFLFPFFYFLPYFLIKSIDYIHLKKHLVLNQKSVLVKVMNFIMMLNLFIFVIVLFRPMTTKIYLYKSIYDQFENARKIYYTDNNPFEEISFYKRKKLHVLHTENKLDSTFFIKNRGEFIITIPEKKHLFKKEKLLFQTYPDWLYSFNIGNWIGKSEQYLIYKL